MILPQEITSIAKITNLLPTTVEKDYVLSWVLYGTSQHHQLSEWFFKGGTCLKKCYFETYRFSEDLDFTVPNHEIYSIDEIKNALKEVAEIVYEHTGINLQTREIEIKESVNKRNKITYIAKFTYLGPLKLPTRTQQRIKFDITNDEIIVDSSDYRQIFHPYSDAPSSITKIKCYSVNEILAEKNRAIYERQGRARDIYDIVNISRNFRDHVEPAKTRTRLKEKFKFKSLPEPSVNLICSQINLEQLNASWKDQLGHQLPMLPPVESFYNDLESAISWWINEHPDEIVLPLISNSKQEKIEPRIHFPEMPGLLRNTSIDRHAQRRAHYNCLDQIRYAARNRLCIEILYHGILRLVEPYSLRQANTGNLLLYAYELKKGTEKDGGIKAYKVPEIANATIMQQAFSPRFIVEL